MSRSSKGNLPWVDVVGLVIAKNLSQRFGRPFSFFQSGPYNQQKPPPVGVDFNEPILHLIDPLDTKGSVDFRLGYYIHRYYSKKNDTWFMVAGFEILNQTLAQRFFTRNLRSGAYSIAIKLNRWLNLKGGQSYANFGVSETERYEWKLADSLDFLVEQLQAYGDLGRSKKDVGRAMTRFQVGTELPAFENYTEELLVDEAERFSKAISEIFSELDFLYRENYFLAV